MTILKSRTIAMLLILFVSSFLLFSGCGRKEAQDNGCPSGSYVANSTDSISAPADGSVTVSSSYNGPSVGGTILLSPLVFTVNDSSGKPRNNVCLTFYTDGFWYTDKTYSILANGTGPINSVLAVTDDNGQVTLYWSTENLPPANLKVASTTTPVTYTAGADQTGDSWVEAYSGTLTKKFTESWTVKGEPAQ